MIIIVTRESTPLGFEDLAFTDSREYTVRSHLLIQSMGVWHVELAVVLVNLSIT